MAVAGSIGSCGIDASQHGDRALGFGDWAWAGDQQASSFVFFVLLPFVLLPSSSAELALSLGHVKIWASPISAHLLIIN